MVTPDQGEQALFRPLFGIFSKTWGSSSVRTRHIVSAPRNIEKMLSWLYIGPPPPLMWNSLSSLATAAAGLAASSSSKSGSVPVRTACSA